ncbi:MAG: hypothetical protein RR749_03165 [Comamonas sp.]|uniref:hypothetical protein n=1 Tax=Comamonas sp. BIGb0152 TaxID=2940601 RepID=UPI002168B0B5|nr:hypothetical protein [Comamonas sp. BIGb0152]MCS4293354.1 hypothetical protein [Comamonas sp. BIGb0152]
MFVFPLSTEGSFWASLKSWAFPWIPIPQALDQQECVVSDPEKDDQEQDQKINRDA